MLEIESAETKYIDTTVNKISMWLNDFDVLLYSLLVDVENTVYYGLS